MRVERGLEPAHQGKVGARRTPDVDLALELSWTPRKSGGGVFRSAKRKNGGGGFGQAIEQRLLARRWQESKINDTAGTSEDSLRKRSLLSEAA